MIPWVFLIRIIPVSVHYRHKTTFLPKSDILHYLIVFLCFWGSRKWKQYRSCLWCSVCFACGCIQVMVQGRVSVQFCSC